VDDCSAQLTWRASPAEDLRVEIGDFVACPVASPRAELVLSLLGSLGAPHPWTGPGRGSGSTGDSNEVIPGGTAGDWPAPLGTTRRWAPLHLAGTRPLDPAWPAGPGALLVEGLSPGTTYDVVASARGVPRFRAGRFRTLCPPGGRLLCRFATVSDLHIGEQHFGVMGRIYDGFGTRAGAETYPVRCLLAAMAEAARWGAELVVAKGDLTRQATPAELRDAGKLLAACPVPVEAILGNHDNQFGADAHALLASQGISVPWQPWARDLPGLRLVLVQTPHGDPRYHRGQLPKSAARRVVELAAGPPTPAWVALHHPPEMHRYPVAYPRGIPFGESRELLDALAAAKPASFVTCGHRHRSRLYRFGPLAISEVGSTKDYPGVWAGYKVYEGGIVQTVRRTSHPDVIAWTEATRRAMNGQWCRWAPGRLEDRCFTVEWPAE